MPITVTWSRFGSFFLLYGELRNAPQLIYAIGETHHVYIGSVGCKGGQGGLGVRYEPQYIDRAKAIFGADAPSDQPAFAGQFEAAIPRGTISDIEKLVQWRFLQWIDAQGIGREQALFGKHPAYAPDVDVVFEGELPKFLRTL